MSMCIHVKRKAGYDMRCLFFLKDSSADKKLLSLATALHEQRRFRWFSSSWRRPDASFFHVVHDTNQRGRVPVARAVDTTGRCSCRDAGGSPRASLAPWCGSAGIARRAARRSAAAARRTARALTTMGAFGDWCWCIVTWMALMRA